jgi:hypothetical protein
MQMSHWSSSIEAMRKWTLINEKAAGSTATFLTKTMYEGRTDSNHIHQFSTKLTFITVCMEFKQKLIKNSKRSHVFRVLVSNDNF